MDIKNNIRNLRISLFLFLLPTMSLIGSLVAHNFLYHFHLVIKSTTNLKVIYLELSLQNLSVIKKIITATEYIRYQIN